MNQVKTTTVFYMKNRGGNIQLGKPNVRTFSQPMALIRLDRGWVKKAAVDMGEDEIRYFIIDPNDDTKGILLDENRTVDWDGYSKAVQETRDCPHELTYSALGMTGAVGKVCNRLKKYWKERIWPDPEHFSFSNMRKEDKEGIIKELGDMLWYINDLALGLGSSLYEVALTNIRKVRNRTQNKPINHV